MSTPIEEKIVKMTLQNSDFISRIGQTLAALTGLENKFSSTKNLNLNSSVKSAGDLQSAVSKVDMGGLEKNVGTVASRFSALGIMATTALATITNKVVTTGASMVKGLTVEPVLSGYNQYENKLKSIQVILANTQGKSSLGDVTKSLGELNEYASKTVYSFQDMTTNMGTFTAAGVDLDTAKTAIQGIGNLAAASGSSTQQAATAMYQLSQAIASGKVGLMDWNSVVNAGMGGKKFQTALEQSAASMGHARDMTKSFRDSLQDGWLTTEVLMDTLSKFATDKSMLKAATQAKTFSDVMSTTKETVQTEWAALWEKIFGDFNQAPKLWTGVANAVTGSIADVFIPAIKTMDTLMNKLGGRKVVIEGLGNVFKTLGQVVGAVKDGFREVFPPATAKQLLEMVKNFRDFTKSMLLSKSTMSDLKNTFAGFFAVLDIIRKVIVIVAKAFMNLIPGNLGGGILDVTGGLGKMLVNLDKSISTGKGVTGIFKSMGGMFEGLVDILGAFGNAIKIVVGHIVDIAKALWDNAGPAIKSLASGLGKLVGKMDINTLLGAGGVAALLSGAKSFKKIGDAVKDFGGTFTDFLKKAQEGGKAIDFIKDALSGLTKAVNVAQLLAIATATVALAGSIKMLSDLNVGDIVFGLGAMGAAIGFLVKAMGILSGIKVNPLRVIAVSTALLELSGAIINLSLALKLLSTIDFEDMMVALLGLAGGLTVMTVAMRILSKLSGGMVLSASGMFILSTAILELAAALKVLSSIPMNDMGTALVGLGGSLAIMVVAMAALSKVSGPIGQNAISLTLLSTAMLALSGSLAILSGIPLDNLTVALIGLAGSLTLMVGATLLLGKSSAGSLAGSVAMVALSVAIGLLAGSLAVMSAIPLASMGVAMLGLAGGLAAMTLSLVALNASGPGVIISAGAMVLMGAAIMELSASLIALSAVPIMNLVAGVAALAGVITVISIAAIAVGDSGMGGLALLGFAAVLGSVGLALAGAGLAFSAFAAVLTLLASMTSSQVNNISNSFTGLLQGLITNIPLIIQAATEFIMGLVNALVQNIPTLAAAGLQLIVGLLQAISSNIYQIVSLGIQIIIQFSQALIDNMPTLVNTGVQLIVTFISSMAQAIYANTPQIVAAIMQLIEAILLLVVEALTKVGEVLTSHFPWLQEQVGNMGKGAEQALKDSFDSAGVGLSKGQDFANGISSKNGNAKNAGKGLSDNAHNGATGSLNGEGSNHGSTFASGILGNERNVKGAGSSLHDAASQGTKHSLNPEGDYAGAGFESGLSNRKRGILGAAQDIVDSLTSSMRKALGIHSPSRVLMKIGAFTGMGFAKGLDNQVSNVVSSSDQYAEAARKAGENAASALNDALNADLSQSPTITPVLDMRNVSGVSMPSTNADVTGVKMAKSITGKKMEVVQQPTAGTNSTHETVTNITIYGTLDQNTARTWAPTLAQALENARLRGGGEPA